MNTRKILKYIRIISYVSLIIFLIILKFIDGVGTCYINEKFGIVCPTCGITRATYAMLNRNFSLAVYYNAYFIFVLLPAFLILLIDDIISMVIKKKSFIEIILGQ